MSEPASYSDYHKQVVDACCALMGEQNRGFFEKCDFRVEYVAGDKPEDVAVNQRDSVETI